jgi:hypothetical protein
MVIYIETAVDMRGSKQNIRPLRFIATLLDLIIKSTLQGLHIGPIAYGRYHFSFGCIGIIKLAIRPFQHSVNSCNLVSNNLPTYRKKANTYNPVPSTSTGSTGTMPIGLNCCVPNFCCLKLNPPPAYGPPRKDMS